MKKIFFVLTMLLFSGLLFAENSIKDYIAEFLSKGSCIEVLILTFYGSVK